MPNSMKTSATIQIRRRFLVIGLMVIIAFKGSIAAVEYSQILEKNWVRTLIFNEELGP
jgi:hypothetical protein